MFNWDNYWVLANQLSKNPGAQAEWRSAISRAYYAARAYTKTQPNPPQLDHTLVVNWLRESNRHQKLGNQLAALKKDRHDADSNVRIQINAYRAEVALKLSKCILEEVSKLSPSE
jgi:hypothetical protein